MPSYAENTAIENGTVFEYGLYPQSMVTDPELLSAFGEMELEFTPYQYYRGSGYKYTPVLDTDIMRYADFDYAGEKYRAVIIDNWRPESILYNTMTYQSNAGFELNKIYYYKWEKISWKVFDSDTGLAVSEKIIDSQPFSQSNIHYIKSEGDYYYDYSAGIFNYDYAYSDIRSFLNDEFLPAAFSQQEQDNIKVTHLENKAGGSTINSIYDGHDTDDKIYLLSQFDIDLPSPFYEQESDRQKTYTDYALIQGLNASDGYAVWYTRTNRGLIIAAIDASGEMKTNQSTVTFAVIGGVVPAMNLDNFDFLNTGCSHGETSVIGYVAPTCSSEGYTGDTVCCICGETISVGQVIPKSAHTEAEPVIENEVAAT